MDTVTSGNMLQPLVRPVLRLHSGSIWKKDSFQVRQTLVGMHFASVITELGVFLVLRGKFCSFGTFHINAMSTFGEPHNKHSMQSTPQLDSVHFHLEQFADTDSGK